MGRSSSVNQPQNFETSTPNSHTESDQVNQDSDKTPENTRKKSKDISGKLKNKQRDRSSSLVEKSTGPSVSVEKTLRKQSKSKDDILTKKNKKNKNKDESGGKKPKKSKKNKVDSEVLKSGKSKSVSKLLEATSDSELAVDNEFEIDRRRKSYEKSNKSPNRRKSIDLISGSSTKEHQRIQEQIEA